MTNTDTADIASTAKQVADLARAGSELVRITVDRDEAAKAVPHIRDQLRKRGVDVPLIGDFHYIGHKLLGRQPGLRRSLDKYRINPGNVGFKDKKDRQFGAIIETALEARQASPHWRQLGFARRRAPDASDGRQRQVTNPRSARSVMHEAMVQSALLSAERAEEMGSARDRIIVSGKVSSVQDLLAVYAMLADRSRYALHSD